MSEYKKSFKKLVEELANLDSMDERSVYAWFNRCDLSYQYEGITYKDWELLLKLTYKITEKK